MSFDTSLLKTFRSVSNPLMIEKVLLLWQVGQGLPRRLFPANAWVYKDVDSGLLPQMMRIIGAQLFGSFQKVNALASN